MRSRNVIQQSLGLFRSPLSTGSQRLTHSFLHTFLYIIFNSSSFSYRVYTDDDISDKTIEKHTPQRHKIRKIIHPLVHQLPKSYNYLYQLFISIQKFDRLIFFEEYLISIINDDKNNKIIKQMEQRQISRSEQKIQKMNSSMLVFRQLIESLRVKNQQLIKPSSADINPESEKQSSSQSMLYSSEKLPTNLSIVNNISNSSKTNPNLMLSSFSAPVEQDQGIRLKARGNVAGRDILYKKPSVVSSSKFNQTVSSAREFARNKNIAVATSTVDQSEKKFPDIEQIKMLIKKQQITNKKNEMQTSMDVSEINKNMTTMPLMRPKFQQNKLNLRGIAARNKIKDINQADVIKYCKQSRGLHQGSQANQIFDFFDGLMAQVNVAILSPFIKKFKNCVYFGAPVSDDEIYEGFLYFYENKIYYGEFLKNQKSGKGVEIILDEQAIFKGNFRQGQKTGKFWVKRQNQTYVGFLQKGFYHGQGKLQTKESIYQGQFQNGEKHGFGQQFFPKTGVKMVGYFDQGTFSKRSKSSFSHSDIQKAIKFKSSDNKKAFQTNKDHFHNKRNSNVSYLQQEEAQGTMRQQNHLQNQFGLYTPPFASTNNFQSRKKPFNKEKIRSFLPGMSNQKFIEPMPENCRDFDYSFDVSSKRDTQILAFQGVQQGRNRSDKQKKGFLPPFGQIQQEHHHLDTSAFQQPLPMPCFLKK